MVTTCVGHRRKPSIWPPGGRRLERAIGWLATRAAPTGRRAEAGQATVEFVALLPVLVLAALAMGQGAVAGYTAWSAAGAARMAARAQALGGAPGAAARSELPRFLDRGSRIQIAGRSGPAAGRVTVRLRVPSVVPGLRFGTVVGRAQLPDQVGG